MDCERCWHRRATRPMAEDDHQQQLLHWRCVNLYEQYPSRSLMLLGAVNPRDSDLKISSDGDHIVFHGFKNFNTGGVVSDLTVLEGALEGSDAHIFAFAPTQQSGIQFAVSRLEAILDTIRKLTDHSTIGIISAYVSQNRAASRSMRSQYLGRTLSVGTRGQNNRSIPS